MDALLWRRMAPVCLLFALTVCTVSADLSSLQGRTVRVTTMVLNPYIYETEVEGNKTYNGFMKELLDIIFDKFGLKYELYSPPDGYFGSLNKTTGKWTGAIGEVTAGAADLAAGPITVTQKREEVVDFSQPFLFSQPVIVMRKPDESKVAVSDRLSHILKPFELSVWLLVFMSYLMASTIIYIISHFNPYDWRRMARDGEATIREGESFTCMNSFWFAMGTLLLQGFTRAPRSVGCRVAVSAWWVFVLILVSAYIGNLSNLLRLGPRPTEVKAYVQIRSFDDLAIHSGIKIAYVKSGATEEFFRNSKNPSLIQIYNKMQSEDGVEIRTLQEGIDKLKENEPGAMALISESAMAKYYTSREGCKLYYVNDPVTTRHYSLVFPSNADYKNEFDLTLLELQDSGKLTQLEDSWFQGGTCARYSLERSQDEKFEIPSFYALDVGILSGALFILGLGLLIGGVITAIEVFIYKFAEEEETREPEAGSQTVKQNLIQSTPNEMTAV